METGHVHKHTTLTPIAVKGRGWLFELRFLAALLLLGFPFLVSFVGVVICSVVLDDSLTSLSHETDKFTGSSIRVGLYWALLLIAVQIALEVFVANALSLRGSPKPPRRT